MQHRVTLIYEGPTGDRRKLRYADTDASDPLTSGFYLNESALEGLYRREQQARPQKWPPPRLTVILELPD